MGREDQPRPAVVADREELLQPAHVHALRGEVLGIEIEDRVEMGVFCAGAPEILPGLPGDCSQPRLVLLWIGRAEVGHRRTVRGQERADKTREPAAGRTRPVGAKHPREKEHRPDQRNGREARQSGQVPPQDQREAQHSRFIDRRIRGGGNAG
ncbi:hypothetical protein GCM10025880_05730 [Methylorubrum aminovorans]|nr:hypothetical protein GCM10025880_05730 [Methylorubrum aminovorans]